MGKSRCHPGPRVANRCVSASGELWYGVEERARIGLLWRVEYFLRRPHFDDLAAIHHGNPVAEMTHDGKVMTDEQQRQAQFFAQLQKKVENLRLNGALWSFLH